MSWYSKIYVFARDYRGKNPVRGFFLHLSLNGLLFFQICGCVYLYYVYVFVICGFWLTNAIQITIYLILFNSLLFLTLWSLFTTISTPIARVPDEYKAPDDVDAKLKAVTPKTGERYFPDQSSFEQVQQQNKILDEFAAERALMFVEVDAFGRLRYCYQCSVVKPDRTHHCSSCGFCVIKFDHHCPWINKCVNAANYKFFCLYLFYGTTFMAFGLLTSLETLVRFGLGEPSKTWDRFLPVTVSIFMQIAFTYYPLGELLQYHSKLVWDAETTCECAKTPIIRGGDTRLNYNVSPYRNYRSVFGWGLWLFPVNTAVGDGRHFHVKYPEDYTGERYEIVPRTSTTSSSQQFDPNSNNNNNNNNTGSSAIKTIGIP